MHRPTFTLLLLFAASVCSLWTAGRLDAAPQQNAGEAAQTTADTTRGDRMLVEYFRDEVRRLSEGCLSEIQSADDWNARRDEYRRQLREMLSLDPLPERTPLNAVVTGTVERDDFVVEKLHFQSLPGLYVTGNLYRPREVKGKLPAILYVCGHGQVKKDNVSFGNKVHYQHHGAWFARNGYVCLTIDTVQLGEIEGIHHGTYKYDMWWWNALGYTPAGVEAWNGIRALDYLETRDEVDKERMGVTGRSGGGAYSWWIAALDERVKVAVPVAGITSLKNHVVDNCVEGHCDCMYPVNTYRWDFGQVAALVSPRPLLISNTDKDSIFPLDGVVDVYNKARRIYELQGARNKIGLQITEGGHVDTQELHIHAFHWFNRFLKGDDPAIEMAAVPFFTPAELKVFDTLPADQRTATIHESFVAPAEPPPVPSNREEWQSQRDAWMQALREKCFAGWPAEAAAGGGSLEIKQAFSAPCGSIHVTAYDFTSQKDVRLRLFLAHSAKVSPEKCDRVVLNVLDDEAWRRFLALFSLSLNVHLKGEETVRPDVVEFAHLRKQLESSTTAFAYVAPRGVGPTEWTRDPKKRIHIRRRFMLVGQTLDGMRAWDVRRAIQAVRALPGLAKAPLELAGERDAACWTLYASLFEPEIAQVSLWLLPASHRTGPDFLNVLRYLDVPQAAALAAERSRLLIHQTDGAGWDYPAAVAKALAWDDARLQVLKDVEGTAPASGNGKP